MSKRFTDAELAAEYWRAEWTFQYDARTAEGDWPNGLGLTAKTKAFHRFVTTPHYDEAQP